MAKIRPLICLTTLMVELNLTGSECTGIKAQFTNICSNSSIKKLKQRMHLCCKIFVVSFEQVCPHCKSNDGVLQNHRPPTTDTLTDSPPSHRSPTTDHRPTDRCFTEPPTTDKFSTDPPTH